MLGRGHPPDDWDTLIAAARLKEGEHLLLRLLESSIAVHSQMLQKRVHLGVQNHFSMPNLLIYINVQMFFGSSDIFDTPEKLSGS